MQYHPDKNQENQYTTARFIEIQEAYQILSDSHRRAKYDDERWLMGMDKKQHKEETITPAWLLDVSIKLNRSLAKMDTHRISHGALAEYILLILADAHIGVLQQHNDESKNTEIITQLMQASRWLEPRYLAPVLHRLNIVAGQGQMQPAIAAYKTEREKEAFREKMFPYIILLVTLALCVFMYFYGKG
jgi:curved DNA-binding protein CbpA